jgi:hypothetical protein
MPKFMSSFSFLTPSKDFKTSMSVKKDIFSAATQKLKKIQTLRREEHVCLSVCPSVRLSDEPARDRRLVLNHRLTIWNHNERGFGRI